MKIQLSHYEFDLTERYADGSVLNAAEAKALNILRGEKIRNKVARKLEAMVEDKGEVLTGQRLEELREAVRKIDSNFEFTSRDTSKNRSSSLEAAIREVAEAKARALARERGREADAGLIKQLYIALLEDPNVEAEAAIRVEARTRAAYEGIKDL